MAKIVDRPVTLERASNITVSIGLLPTSEGVSGLPIIVQNTPVSYLITNGSTGLTAGAEAVELTSDTDVTLRSGTRLDFAGVLVVIARDVALTSVAATANILPLRADLPDAATASTYALLIFHGLTQINPTPELAETDVKTYQDGLGARTAVLAYAPSLELTGNSLFNSVAQGLVEEQAWNSARVGLDMWVRCEWTERGRILEGSAIVASNTLDSPVGDRVQSTLSVKFQGEPLYTPPSDIVTSVTEVKALSLAQGAAILAA